MKKIKELLRLHYEHGLSYRELSRRLGMGLGSVSHYLKRAKEAQIGWPLPEGLSDEELRQCVDYILTTV
jgi:transposase